MPPTTGVDPSRAAGGPESPSTPELERLARGTTVRCSDAARERGDQLSGTAPPATRWLLVEHPGAWGLDELAGSDLDEATQRHLRAAANHAEARLLTIRRPGRRGSLVPAEKRWMVARRGAATVQGHWREPADLEAAVRELEQPTSERATGSPLILVCTQGARDVCCALRGRPVAAELARHWPEETWEVSHVGGDRFAPNVVLLPDGVYYGRLDPETAPGVVADHLAGRVRTDHLRGYAGYPPPAQAAMTVLLDRLGRDAHTLRYLGTVGDRFNGWQVSFAVGDDGIEVQMSASAAPEARLTCRAVSETSSLLYRVEDIDGPAGLVGQGAIRPPS